MATDLGVSIYDLIDDQNLRKKIDPARYVNDKIGLPTLRDILVELDKPGLDPRGNAKVFEFHPHIKSIEDLEIGMQVPGLVTNNTKFGSFVNIGVKQDGLIHISQTGGEVMNLEDQILVKILDVDVARMRINLKYIERI